MHNRSRHVLMTLGTLVLAGSVGLGAAAAQAAAAGQEGKGQRHERQWQGPRGGLGPGGGPMAMLRGLNLTDEQREQIRAIVQEQRRAAGQAGNHLDLHRQLRAALLADVPDHAAIDQLRAQLAERQAAGLERMVDVQLRIAQVLTPEQREQLRTRLAQRAERPAAGQRRGIR